jgi:DNA-binding Lrp family transcriptional regulator
MHHFWHELDHAILACRAGGDDTPLEIGQRLGISEAAVSSILAMLVVEGRVRICRVALGHRGVTGAALSPADTRCS